jgi:hypothetical protein
MSCSSEAAGEAAVEADVAAALARALRTDAGVAHLRGKRNHETPADAGASRRVADSAVGYSCNEGGGTSGRVDSSTREGGFGSFKLPEFRWPWQQQNEPSRVPNVIVPSSPLASSPRVPEGDVRLRVRPLNEREQAQVGGLVQQLMGQGGSRLGGGSDKFQ